MRLPVDRVFSVKGFGTVVTGTLVSGQVREEDELVALPPRRAVRVRGIQVHGTAVPDVRAPGRVALNLGAIDVSEIARGVTLATAGSLAVTRRLDVRLEGLPGGRELRHGSRLRVHQGTSETTARLVLSAIRLTRDAPWQLLQPGEAQVVVRAGGEAYGRLRLEQAMAVTRGDRLVLRSITPPCTIGGAVVLDPEPPATALRRQRTLDRFSALDPPAFGDAAVLRVWLAESGAGGLTSTDAVRRGGLDPALSGRHRWISSSLAGKRWLSKGDVFPARPRGNWRDRSRPCWRSFTATTRPMRACRARLFASRCPPTAPDTCSTSSWTPCQQAN